MEVLFSILFQKFQFSEAGGSGVPLLGSFIKSCDVEDEEVKVSKERLKVKRFDLIEEVNLGLLSQLGLDVLDKEFERISCLSDEPDDSDVSDEEFEKFDSEWYEIKRNLGSGFRSSAKRRLKISQPCIFD